MASLSSPPPLCTHTQAALETISILEEGKAKELGHPNFADIAEILALANILGPQVI